MIWEWVVGVEQYKFTHVGEYMSMGCCKESTEGSWWAADTPSQSSSTDSSGTGRLTNIFPPIPISRSPLSASPISPKYLAHSAHCVGHHTHVRCWPFRQQSRQRIEDHNSVQPFGNPYASPWSNDHRRNRHRWGHSNCQHRLEWLLSPKFLKY